MINLILWGYLEIWLEIKGKVCLEAWVKNLDFKQNSIFTHLIFNSFHKCIASFFLMTGTIMNNWKGKMLVYYSINFRSSLHFNLTSLHKSFSYLCGFKFSS